MKKISLTQLKSLSSIKMRKEERLAMRSALLLHIAPRPSVHRHRRAVPSPFVAFFTHMRAVQVIASLLVVLIASSGSLAYASEGTLPGDTLYPIKINVTERVESGLARTPERKLAVAQTHIKRRLAEVKTLKKEGKLNKQTAQIAKDALLSHAGDVKENIAILASEGKSSEVTQASADIVATLTDFKKAELSVVVTPPVSDTQSIEIPTSVTATEDSSTLPSVDSTEISSLDAVIPSTVNTIDDGIFELTQAIDDTVSASVFKEETSLVQPPTDTSVPEVIPIVAPVPDVPTEKTTAPEVLQDAPIEKLSTTTGSLHGKVTMEFTCGNELDNCIPPDDRELIRKITIMNSKGVVVAKVVTQSDGTFAKELPVGLYTISIDTQEREIARGISDMITIVDHKVTNVSIHLFTLIR
jgi:hypothetical protein